MHLEFNLSVIKKILPVIVEENAGDKIEYDIPDYTQLSVIL
jgi:hypothetical protein